MLQNTDNMLNGVNCGKIITLKYKINLKHKFSLLNFKIIAWCNKKIWIQQSKGKRIYVN